MSLKVRAEGLMSFLEKLQAFLSELEKWGWGLEMGLLGPSEELQMQGLGYSRSFLPKASGGKKPGPLPLSRQPLICGLHPGFNS